MAKVVYNRNLPRELERDLRYRAALRGKAQEVVDNAKQMAPVKTGAYRDGLNVVEQGAKVYAAGTDFKSHWIEFGTNDTPAFAPLRKGARQAGLKLREE